MSKEKLEREGFLPTNICITDAVDHWNRLIEEPMESEDDNDENELDNDANL
jgi:hypothetical protein